MVLSVFRITNFTCHASCNKDCNGNLFRKILKNWSVKPGLCKAKDCPNSNLTQLLKADLI